VRIQVIACMGEGGAIPTTAWSTLRECEKKNRKKAREIRGRMDSGGESVVRVCNCARAKPIRM
jgi:hypothetical protein